MGLRTRLPFKKGCNIPAPIKGQVPAQNDQAENNITRSILTLVPQNPRLGMKRCKSIVWQDRNEGLLKVSVYLPGRMRNLYLAFLMVTP